MRIDARNPSESKKNGAMMITITALFVSPSPCQSFLFYYCFIAVVPNAQQPPVLFQQISKKSDQYPSWRTRMIFFTREVTLMGCESQVAIFKEMIAMIFILKSEKGLGCNSNFFLMGWISIYFWGGKNYGVTKQIVQNHGNFDLNQGHSVMCGLWRVKVIQMHS